MNFLSKQIIYFFFLLFSCLAFSLSAKEVDLPYVLVSVAPHKFFVEKIAEGTVKVGLLVPAGASAHTYEPTPKQMLAASKAVMWFRTGESFETRAIQALQSYNPKLEIIDLRQGLNLLGSSHHHEGGGCCHSNGMDLHFWLSARMGKRQAQTIADALIQAYPENRELYQANLKKFQQELENLDQQIQTILSTIPNRNILVAHPAYAYFCRDYDLKQYSIEFEGKDPTPHQLTQILNLGRELKIKTIFVQPQYSSKGARLIGSEIGAKIVTLDPYSEHYFNSMLEIAQAFAEG